MAIKAEYRAYIVTALIALVVMYTISHYYKESGETFGVTYVGGA